MSRSRNGSPRSGLQQGDGQLDCERADRAPGRTNPTLHVHVSAGCHREVARREAGTESRSSRRSRDAFVCPPVRIADHCQVLAGGRGEFRTACGHRAAELRVGE